MAQFNLESLVAIFFFSSETLISGCCEYFLKCSSGFEVLKLYLFVTCELGLALLKTLEGVFGAFVSVRESGSF